MYIYVLFLDLLPPNKIHSQNSSTRGFFSCVVLSSFPLLNVWKLLKKAPPTHAHTHTFCISLPLPKTPHLALFFAHLSLILGQLSLPHTPGVYHLLIAHTLAHYNTNQNPSHPRSFTPPWHSAASFSVSIFSVSINTSDSARLSCSQLLFVWSVSPLLLYVWLCMSASLGELVASSQSHGELHYHCTALHLKWPPLCPASYSFAQPAMEELTFFFLRQEWG